MTLSSEARVATDVPRRYMTQLCKHFEHKLPVTYDEAKGRIEFSAGICLLEAGTDALILRAEAADTESLRRVEDVVARHLDRFAFREKPEIAWTENA
jgi:uncharacterized protein